MVGKHLAIWKLGRNQVSFSMFYRKADNNKNNQSDTYNVHDNPLSEQTFKQTNLKE